MTDLTNTDGQEQDGKGDVYHDEHTMRKVHDALRISGIELGSLRDTIINNLQNAGILFRERGKF